MAQFIINIIGCGKLGKTIGKLLSKLPAVVIQGIVNTSIESAEKACEFIGHGKPYVDINSLPSADIYMIATPDSKIKQACDELVCSSNLNKNAIILHFSGSFSSDLLDAAKSKDCHVMSLHPVKSFANPEESVKSFDGTYCGIEGDGYAVEKIKPLFELIGGSLFDIDKRSKSLYHAAGVIANNYLVTLHYTAVKCYVDAGVDEKIAKKLVSMLMSDALRNLQTLSHNRSLTGPIQRGDTTTITKHIDALDSDAATRDIYTSLGITTVKLTEHSDAKKDQIKQTLNVRARL